MAREVEKWSGISIRDRSKYDHSGGGGGAQAETTTPLTDGCNNNQMVQFFFCKTSK